MSTNSLLISSFLLEYVVPLLILVVMAGGLAFALSFLGQKMAIKSDERIQKIRSNLSGVNCGGCGYAGCDAFAQALIDGETSLDKCPLTKNQNKQNIASILGVDVKVDEPMMAVVHCHGGNECHNKSGYQGYGDCDSCNMLAGGNKACEVGCMGLGSCTKVCQYHAITLDERGVARVNNDCVYCGSCIKRCPKGIIGKIPVENKVYIACSSNCSGKIAQNLCLSACTGCEDCAKICPENAIKIKDNLAYINYKKCNNCGKCIDVCPSKCILTR